MSLKVHNVHKSYSIAGTKKKVIDGVDLEIRPGKLVSITGQSGCGKTTLLNVVSGLTTPDLGTVYVNEKKMSYAFDVLSSQRRNKDMGFIFQTFKLLSQDTVMNNVLLPARIGGLLNRERRLYVNEILSKLRIYKYRNTKVAFLSGGQKQRVAIARALVNRPTLILADEPTANLDKETSIDIFNVLEELKDAGKAVLIITHKDYMHDRSDKVYRMDKGKLEAI